MRVWSLLAASLISATLFIALISPLAWRSGGVTGTSRLNAVWLALPLDEPVPARSVAIAQTALRVTDKVAITTTMTDTPSEDLALSDVMPARVAPEMPAVPNYHDYWPVSQLTQRPVLLLDLAPEVQHRWSFAGAGSVVMMLLINEHGEVDRALLQASTLPPEVLPALANDLRQQFQRLRFMPGYLHNAPVRSALRIQLQWE